MKLILQGDAGEEIIAKTVLPVRYETLVQGHRGDIPHMVGAIINLCSDSGIEYTLGIDHIEVDTEERLKAAFTSNPEG